MNKSVFCKSTGEIIRLRNLFVFLCVWLIAAQSLTAQTVPAPSWAKDLIIYEIATRAFTSPNGPESGTFKSTQQQIPYLKQLGINGIWLTGTNLADPTHFYHIWTQYANIDPSKIDPALGTPEDFREFVAECHRNDIRVFMDVITHGVMNNSPLIKEHPQWFRGGSWGMTDFDWQGNHQDLDEWWVTVFSNYVKDFGIDGFRLDVRIHRSDLWHRIRQNAADAGHPIVVFSEWWENNAGSCDFFQHMISLSNHTKGVDWNVKQHHDAAESLNQFTMYKIESVNVKYTDGTSSGVNRETGAGDLKLEVLNEPKPPFAADEKQRETARLRIEGINPEKSVKQITVTALGQGNPRYAFGSQNKLEIGVKGATSCEMELTPFVTDNPLMSTILSCHDDGWEGTPQDRNPYVAKGSRAMFGYSLLFTPTIPLFMSGEEFNADYIPLPNHTPDLYGKGEQGKGRWLYASMIDRNQLHQTSKREMLNDVTRMIAIRKAESDIFTALRADEPKHVKPVSLQVNSIPKGAERPVPVPYMLFNDKKAIVVCANPYSEELKGVIAVSLEGTPLEGAQSYRVTDLWNGGKAKTVSADELKTFTVKMKPDKTARGGLAVLKIEKK